ncbi:hypothetical protein ACFCWT_26605 [Streptomyces olivaceus]|uniref:hypothetical protein n=1 Tax=Streptomyces olivaceus TaxID=47716 RepID=UPI0035D9851F
MSTATPTAFTEPDRPNNLLIRFITGPGSGRSINVNARRRAKVQVPTGRGHNRGRRR